MSKERNLIKKEWHMEMEKFPLPSLPPSLPPFFHACRSDEYHPCTDPLQSFFLPTPAASSALTSNCSLSIHSPLLELQTQSVTMFLPVRTLFWIIIVCLSWNNNSVKQKSARSVNHNHLLLLNSFSFFILTLKCLSDSKNVEIVIIFNLCIIKI